MESEHIQADHIENFKNASRLLDEIFEIFPDVSIFNVSEIAHAVYNDKDLIEEIDKYAQYITEILIGCEYATNIDNYRIRLTPTGIKAKLAGGHTKYQNKIAKEENMKIEKLHYQLKLSKFAYWTYWVTFGFSLAALIISLISLLSKP